MAVQLFRPVFRVNECIEGIREVLESGWAGQGPKCKKFEEEFSSFVGRPRGLYTNSATASLHLAVHLLDLPPGSKIATTPITFCSTNHAIKYAGHVPIFCDVNRDLSMGSESVLNAIRAGARAVIWVHHGGQVSADFYKLMAALDVFEAQGLHIPVIEDCAHAAGGYYREQVYCGGGADFQVVKSRIGSNQRNFAAFSFQAVKNMPTADSGFLFCPTPELTARAEKLVWLGIDKTTFSRTNTSSDEVYKWRYTIEEIGWKYNANDVMAAIALVQLKYLDEDNAYRANVYEWYRKHLAAAGLYLVEHQTGSSHHLVNVLIKNREEAIVAMKKAGYAPGVHYLPNQEFPVYADCAKYAQPLTVTNAIAEHILTLPNHLEITEDHVQAVVQALKSVS